MLRANNAVLAASVDAEAMARTTSNFIVAQVVVEQGRQLMGEMPEVVQLRARLRVHVDDVIVGNVLGVRCHLALKRLSAKPRILGHRDIPGERRNDTMLALGGKD